MTSSLVGSEMCIRDRFKSLGEQNRVAPLVIMREKEKFTEITQLQLSVVCLLYTSDAADDM
eukprot:9349593-Prorocentrum_lima.AAC.1